MNSITKHSTLRRSLMALGLAAPGLALAGAGVYDIGPESCTALNCNAQTISGSYLFDASLGNSLPFTTQVYTGGNECVRIDVTVEGTDLEATLTCPDGETWRVDDRSTSNARPLIVAQTSSKGWCTLSLAHFVGQGTTADFTLRYGRYPVGNSPNCTSATTPLGALSQTATPAKGPLAVDRPMNGPTGN